MQSRATVAYGWTLLWRACPNWPASSETVNKALSGIRTIRTGDNGFVVGSNIVPAVGAHLIRTVGFHAEPHRPAQKTPACHLFRHRTLDPDPAAT